MKKPETLIANRIDDYLKALGGFWTNIHGEAFQKGGDPDRIGCYKGRYVGIEIKQPGKVPSKLQEKRIRDIRKNQGFAEVCESVDDVKKLISVVDKFLQV